MDIDLLSKMVKELILDNDEVYLPGIGSFVAELVPSTFSDKGYTINPPYRRLSFRQRQDGTDTALIDFYIRSNNLEREAGLRIIRDFLEEMKEVLEQKKSIVFPGLGRLRATRENNFFFVADEDLDIYPEGFGLEPVSLKTHQETKEEVSAALEDLKFIMEENSVNKDAADNEVSTEEAKEENIEEKAGADEGILVETAREYYAETTEEDAQETAINIFEEATEPVIAENTEKSNIEPITEETAKEATDKDTNNGAEPDVCIKESAGKATEDASNEKEKSIHPALAIIIFIAILAIMALIAFVLIGHINPEFIDKFLYGSEELEILYN